MGYRAEPYFMGYRAEPYFMGYRAEPYVVNITRRNISNGWKGR